MHTCLYSLSKKSLHIENVVHFGFFTNEMECERGKQDFSNKVITPNATSVLIFPYKNVFMAFQFHKIKYYTIVLFQLLQRQICEGNR